MLKVGGKIAYSTCSLSPIENESVVAAAKLRYGDKIEILKVDLPGFKFQEGLTNWKVMMNEDFYEEYQHVKGCGLEIHETMFPATYNDSVKSELTKCLRVMPHHQNTSAFFITIIQKKAEFSDVIQPKEPIIYKNPLAIQELS